mmetsp:Transcript_24424/g.49571  ORF Transcript_24424/g.49571 Transcript_24424/m.49571 type:complete len:251 (+) Transcript_24424:27-779(+)
MIVLLPFAGGPPVRHPASRPPVQLRSPSPSDFDLFKGRVIDTLTHKYTHLYTEKPDFSIFTSDVVLSDSSGKRIQGLQSYERVFDMLHLIRRAAVLDATISHRMLAERGENTTIRIRWSTELSLRGGAVAESLGLATVFNLDGISVYSLDHRGRVYWHSLEDIQLIKDDQAQSVTLEAAMRVGLSAAPMAMAARPPVLQISADGIAVGAAAAMSVPAPASRQRATLTARVPQRYYSLPAQRSIARSVLAI